MYPGRSCPAAPDHPAECARHFVATLSTIVGIAALSIMQHDGLPVTTFP
jgi:hypothetical protein